MIVDYIFPEDTSTIFETEFVPRRGDFVEHFGSTFVVTRVSIGLDREAYSRTIRATVHLEEHQ